MFPLWAKILFLNPCSQEKWGKALWFNCPSVSCLTVLISSFCGLAPRQNVCQRSLFKLGNISLRFDHIENVKYKQSYVGSHRKQPLTDRNTHIWGFVHLSPFVLCLQQLHHSEKHVKMFYLFLCMSVSSISSLNGGGSWFVLFFGCIHFSFPSSSPLLLPLLLLSLPPSRHLLRIHSLFKHGRLFRASGDEVSPHLRRAAVGHQLVQHVGHRHLHVAPSVRPAGQAGQDQRLVPGPQQPLRVAPGGGNLRG